MRIVADLHMHGAYSRGCSKDLSTEKISQHGKVKGLNLMGTGDFQHPLWNKHLKENLEDDGTGILKSREGFNFILQTEIANIYKQDGKTRKIHNVILAPSFDVVDQIAEELKKRGRIDYDGRPIFGFSCIELVEMMKGVDKGVNIIPAHAWTPWFGIFGSMSGFDSLKECFREKTKEIFAIETGLSSDPSMNWRLSSLDNISFISNSDSHSYWPWRIGREANVFELKELTYNNVISAIKDRDTKRFLYTIEVDPSYGKYHFDGHRGCNVSQHPSESQKNRNLCPSCGKPLTVGVLSRVEELADREKGHVPEGRVPFKSLIPLSEIIAASIGTTSIASKKVFEIYYKLIKAFGNELNILLEANKKELEGVVGDKISESIMKIREGSIKVIPGYDGVYGRLVLDESEVQETPEISHSPEKQRSLFEFK